LPISPTDPEACSNNQIWAGRRARGVCDPRPNARPTESLLLRQRRRSSRPDKCHLQAFSRLNSVLLASVRQGQSARAWREHSADICRRERGKGQQKTPSSPPRATGEPPEKPRRSRTRRQRKWILFETRRATTPLRRAMVRDRRRCRTSSGTAINSVTVTSRQPKPQPATATCEERALAGFYLDLPPQRTSICAGRAPAGRA